MSQMRFPLKDHLQDPVDEAALHRIAERIRSRGRGREHRRYSPFVWVGVTAAVGVTIAALLFIRRDAGPLAFADGRELVAVDAGGAAREIALSDGSRIRLSPGAHFEPLESSGESFTAIVTQGRADFDVRPGGPRHWVIECGLATVEVVGTAFACDRGPGRLRVVVSRGVVLVRGDRVPDRARRLSAGETLEVAGGTPGPTPVAVGTVAAPVLPEQVGPVAPEPASAMAHRTDGNSGAHLASARTWRDLARRGRHGEAFAALGSEGLRRESKQLGVNDLLALADVARLSGHPAEAVLPLERILNDFASDAQAPLAAFTLGRLQLDSLGHAHAAVSAFRKALALGIPRSLREDVRARLVEAYAKSGDTGAAQRAADAYHEEYPNGRYTRAIVGWLHLR
ncbi:MAG: FecR domain-containing protein [Polyangiaceae bacterium]|nr:FecR domain-containing protein [Polyangiaceae bacterium]